MILFKKFFLSLKNYFKSEPEKVVLREKTCHHCTSRGVFIYQGAKENEKKK
ncbi:MAG: hypothetical protein LDL01_07035 [Ignavibacterium sp.]|jgi:ribosomal protein S27AE|uniref:hypothetical protein n=1 Tax=Ignavibacterium album TaxID=591197 RepID=UPI0026F22082|nr:hypothetical protein [Ignavibacterium album]MCA2005537.1 hypothetical protein [Ignavibacterium sp.]MCX8104979.1 hypothetical protein [Ignavibacterium album]